MRSSAPEPGAPARDFRAIPSVDRVAQAVEAQAPELSRRLAVDAARAEVDHVRGAVAAGARAPALRGIAAAAALRARTLLADAPVPVVNATGVIVHTNLGRAPLSDRALAAVRAAAAGYSSLEYDLPTGRRGSRFDHVTEVVRQVTGAEAALVVNNNAAAVLLALETFARGREVLAARGEAVEIGGGFRIPEILDASGAVLRDVGTTNRTRLADYAAAIGPATAAVLRVHRSNFALVGFTESPDARALADLAHANGLRLIDDLGSGTLLDTSAYGLAREPLVGEALRNGADVVTFSGDKLLGGPQAGVLVGSADAIAAIAARPLTRALRPDKMTIAGLRATLGHYLRGEAVEQIPVWQMLAARPADLRARAARMAAACPSASVRVVDTQAAVGGGSLPGRTLPSAALEIDRRHGSADEVARRLRQAPRPVIGRIHADQVRLDVRTVLPRDEQPLLDALRAL